MKLNIKIFLFMVALGIMSSSVARPASYTHWVCQDCDPYMEPHYDTITKAIEAAAPGDTILIVAEEFPPGGGKIIEYRESITINKPLTLKCKKIHPVLGQPIITVQDFEQTNSIITIEKSAPGTDISNLHIRGPIKDNTSSDGDSIEQVNKKVGITIETSECSIEQCKVTHCMTGVLIDSGTTGQPSGIQISECNIGEPFVGVIQGYWVKEAEWTDNHKGHPIAHPGNGFGLVIRESTGVTKNKTDETWYTISDCSILFNRYQQVILPPNHVSSL
ncbi:hypothetical protein K8T06_10580 [bacterium]|nr:hypothetical protein [bacterium]